MALLRQPVQSQRVLVLMPEGALMLMTECAADDRPTEIIGKNTHVENGQGADYQEQQSVAAVESAEL
eukprot:500605-Pelagomonas_calceolata.AAC.2